MQLRLLGQTKCTNCKLIKLISDFYKSNKAKDGYRPWCKKCTNVSNNLRHSKNKERYNQMSREWRKKHPGYNKEYNKEYQREYRKKNGRRPENPETKRKRMRRLLQNPEFRLKQNMGTLMYFSLKGNKNYHKWENLTGYTSNDLKNRLERQFTPNMNWDNYGSYWEVDHIVPTSWWNFLSFNVPDFKFCWALDNLRPLEKSLNRKKQSRGNLNILLQYCVKVLKINN